MLVQRRAGCTLDKYLTPRLFEPLGITAPTWETDPLGYSFGAGGLFLCVSELLRFGELLLAGGKWNGRQLLPAEYVAEASAKQVENGAEGYGYLFWRGAHNSFRADGKYGQFAIVLPAASRTACSPSCSKTRRCSSAVCNSSAMCTVFRPAL